LTALGGGRLTIYGNGKQVRDVLYVEDLVELMTRAVNQKQRTAGQIYNVGGGPSHTISIWAEFHELLSKLVGKLPAADHGEFRPGDQSIYVSDIRKAQAQLGWSPQVDLAEGLSRMIDEWGAGGALARLRVAAGGRSTPS
jgi:CDP-paratose 2-epimerase